MAINNLLTQSYANEVYNLGSRHLNDRGDGVKFVPRSPDDYYSEVEKYANAHYTMITMDSALKWGYITQVEYDETLAYGPIPPGTLKSPPVN